MSTRSLQLRSNTTAFKQNLRAASIEKRKSEEHLRQSKKKYALPDLRKQMAELAIQTRQKHLKEAGLIVLKYKHYFVQAMKQERDNYDKKLFRIIRDTSLSPAQRNEKKRAIGQKLDEFLLNKYMEATKIKLFEDFKSATGLDYLKEIENTRQSLIPKVPSSVTGKKSKRCKKANKKTLKKGKKKGTKKCGSK
jgi:hypothetical protein